MGKGRSQWTKKTMLRNVTLPKIGQVAALLLGFLVAMNGVAIWMRQRFEKQW